MEVNGSCEKFDNVPDDTFPQMDVGGALLLLFFLSSIDWDFKSQVKSHDSYSGKLFEPFNFHCFEAHSFSMVVLVNATP